MLLLSPRLASIRPLSIRYDKCIERSLHWRNKWPSSNNFFSTTHVGRGRRVPNRNRPKSSVVLHNTHFRRDPKSHHEPASLNDSTRHYQNQDVDDGRKRIPISRGSHLSGSDEKLRTKLTPSELRELIHRKKEENSLESKSRPFILPPPSEEQKYAMQAFKRDGCNLIVEACAGSGKTTLILHLAEDNPDLVFLVISYSNRLTAETRQRAEGLGLQNTTVSTIHSLGVRYYTQECFTDVGLKRVVEEDNGPRQALPHFDVLILDELQDMTPIMKRFLDKFWRDICAEQGVGSSRKECRVAALGDSRQEIFGFKDSDARFLTHADSDDLFGYLSRSPWKRVDLLRSNRLTPNMVDFINTDVGDPKGKLILSNRARTTTKPRYIVCNMLIDPVEMICGMMEEWELAEDEVLILTPSTRASRSAKRVVNEMAKNGYAIHVPLSEDVEEIDPRVSKGKIVCCTFHQAKGIERRAVFVLNFDSSYQLFYDTTSAGQKHSSNALFVAVTRAKEFLVLFHDYKQEFLSHVQTETLEERVEYIQKRRLADDRRTQKRPESLEFTNLSRHLPDSVLTTCLQHITLKEISPPGYIRFARSLVDDSLGLHEGVADLTGISVPSFHELIYNSQLTIMGELDSRFNSQSEHDDFLKRHLHAIHINRYGKLKRKWLKTHSLEVSEILFLCNLLSAFRTGYATRVHSIPLDGYGWVSQTQALDMADTLDEWIPEMQEEKYEERCEFRFSSDPNSPDFDKELSRDLRKIPVTGAVDVVFGRDGPHPTLIEIKYTTALDPTALLQAAIYGGMMQQKTGKMWKMLLVNVRTGQAVRVFHKAANSTRVILRTLLIHKYKSLSPDAKSPLTSILDLQLISDDGFLEEAHGGFSSRVGPSVLPTWFTAKAQAPKEEIRQRREEEGVSGLI